MQNGSATPPMSLDLSVLLYADTFTRMRSI